MTIRAILFSALLLSGCSVFYLNEEALPLEQTPSTTDIRPSFDLQNTYMIKAYETAATRTTNKMLDDTAEFYEIVPKPKLYVKEIIKDNPNLPDGFYTARRAIKEIAGKSGTYILVNNIDEADYILDSHINEFNEAGLPAIIFRMTINDKSDKPLKAWNVVIRQLSEDQSWW